MIRLDTHVYDALPITLTSTCRPIDAKTVVTENTILRILSATQNNWTTIQHYHATS